MIDVASEWALLILNTFCYLQQSNQQQENNPKLVGRFWHTNTLRAQNLKLPERSLILGITLREMVSLFRHGLETVIFNASKHCGRCV